MRVIRYFVTALLSITILSIIGFLLAREGLLFLSSRRLRDSLEVLKVYAQRNTATGECQRLSDNGNTDGTDIVYQLKFTNSRDYVIEAICPLNRSNPIELASNQLPSYITKVPGTSGYIWTPDGAQGIEIQVFKDEAMLISSLVPQLTPELLIRSRKVVVDNGIIETNAAALPQDPGPTTMCEGYGYTCCDTIAATGSGSQITGLSECPESCFAECINRPIVLSFNSNPFFDLKTRTVTIASGEPLEFSFVAAEASKSLLRADIDFGDGENKRINSAKGTVPHTYTCSTSFCTYTAKILLTDDQGVESIETPISRLTVQVRGQ